MAEDPKSIEALKRMLERPDAILDLVSTSLAEESIGLIKDGFRTETDPYGQKWKPKKRPDGRKTLSGKTSRLKGGWKIVRQDRHEVRVSPSVNYAAAHQDPQPRVRLGDREALRRAARGVEVGRRRRQLFDSEFVGPAQLKRPRRMMVPDDARGLPPKWEKTLNEAATDAFAAIFGGDGRRISAIKRKLGVGSLLDFSVGA